MRLAVICRNVDPAPFVTAFRQARPNLEIAVWPDVAPDAQALARFCRGRLAGFKVPREFRFVGALPRTAAGKLRRTELPGIVAGE